MNEPLTPERAAEIRDRADRRMEKCRRRGQVSLADLECAKNEVHDLADEIDRLRAERDRYAHQLDGMCLAQWEDEQEAEAEPRAEQAAEIDRLREELGATRSAVLNEALEAARSEYLHDNTGTPEDEAYNQGVTDAVAAIGALLEGGDL